MNYLLESGLTEVIKKNLPQEVGDALRARLNEADNMERLIPTLEREIQRTKSALDDRTALVDELNAQVMESQDLDAREEHIAKRERNQDIFELKAKLEANQDCLQKVYGFVDSLMRNTVFRENVFGGVTDPNGRGSSTSESKEKTAE